MSHRRWNDSIRNASRACTATTEAPRGMPRTNGKSADIPGNPPTVGSSVWSKAQPCPALPDPIKPSPHSWPEQTQTKPLTHTHTHTHTHTCAHTHGHLPPKSGPVRACPAHRPKSKAIANTNAKAKANASPKQMPRPKFKLLPRPKAEAWPGPVLPSRTLVWKPYWNVLVLWAAAWPRPGRGMYWYCDQHMIWPHVVSCGYLKFVVESTAAVLASTIVWFLKNSLSAVPA